MVKPETKELGELLKKDIDPRPQKGMWAPGHYIRYCSLCGKTFTGDKRAMWCADCAYDDKVSKEPVLPKGQTVSQFEPQIEQIQLGIYEQQVLAHLGKIQETLNKILNQLRYT